MIEAGSLWLNMELGWSRYKLECFSCFDFWYILANGDGFACCAQNDTPLEPSVLQSLVHCMPITIPIDDPQLMNTDERCMNFVRSSTGPNRINCNLSFVSYAEQVSFLSKFQYHHCRYVIAFFIQVQSKFTLARRIYRVWLQRNQANLSEK